MRWQHITVLMLQVLAVHRKNSSEHHSLKCRFYQPTCFVSFRTGGVRVPKRVPALPQHNLQKRSFGCGCQRSPFEAGIVGEVETDKESILSHALYKSIR